jgi:hypothetical protein
MIVTAALYARVSTPKQEEEATIDSQIAAIERYIRNNSYELIFWIRPSVGRAWSDQLWTNSAIWQQIGPSQSWFVTVQTDCREAILISGW